MVFTDLLAWAVIVLFLSTVIVDRFHRKAARFLAGSVWALFGIFWGLLFPKFAFGMHSFIEGTLSLIAVPACIYVGWLHIQGRDSLFVITRSVAFMGLIYAPFMMIEPLRQWIVETVAYQVHFLIEILGYNPEFIVHQETGYKSKFVFHSESGTYATFIILACTGIGSMAVFGGVIAALDAPIGRKLRGLALALPIIYVLNLFRNAFIAIAFGKQWFQIYVPIIQDIVGYQHPGLVSFFIADRVISQSLSLLALLAITAMIIRVLPEVTVIIEELLFILTGNEYNFEGDNGSGGSVIPHSTVQSAGK